MPQRGRQLSGLLRREPQDAPRGAVEPVAFTAPALGHRTLVVASDGLWRYARSAEIAAAARLPTLEEAAAALLALVRLPSGGLQDDVGIVLVRALS